MESVGELVSFTAGMAAASTLLLLIPGLALAWLLARKDWPGKAVVETLVSLPLVLPPVVTGLALLTLFGRRSPLGGWLESSIGLEIAFTWKAVLIALAVMSFPLFVRSVRAAIEVVDPTCEQIARTLGAGEFRIFLTVTLPLARSGLIAGSLLAFARALGEFGATVMFAGNIPGETTVLSVAIYQMVQIGDDTKAWILALAAGSMAFAAVLIGEILHRRAKP